MGRFRAKGGLPPSRRVSIARVFAAGALLVFVAPLLSGWKVTGTNVHYAYYPVSGRSHAEIVRSVRRFAPRGGYAYGLGFIDFHPDYDIAAEDGSCRISRAETGLTIRLKLPEWKGPQDAPRKAARLGRHFERSIRQHELQHVKIAERYARKISRELLKLKSAKNCWDLRRSASELISRAKRQHIESQKAFDRKTLKQIRRLL